MNQAEDDLLRRVIEAAQDWLGWEALHVRAGRSQRGRWTVPVQGSLGKGWPDLVLVHRGKGRTLAAELKIPPRKATEDQLRVLDVLAGAGWETYLWTPADWDAIVAILAGPRPS